MRKWRESESDYVQMNWERSDERFRRWVIYTKEIKEKKED